VPADEPQEGACEPAEHQEAMGEPVIAIAKPKWRRAGLGSRLLKQAMYESLGRQAYLMLRRAERAGYCFKTCRERDGRLTIRPWDYTMVGKPNRGCLVKTCYVKRGKRKDSKTWTVVTLDKAKRGTTFDVPKVWRAK
jgi:hypothetical protein